MAKITGGEPEEQKQAQAEDVPEQREREEERRVERQERQMGEAARTVDAAPKITVLGHMDSQIAVRLGWKKGMTAISVSRFKFLRDELGFDVTDEPDNYLF